MANDRIVGIDLGTTNSLVAFMQGESPVVIPGEDGLNLVPSVVALDERNQTIVGNAARKYLIETPERAVYSIKRLMGRGVEDIQDELKLFPFRLAEELETHWNRWDRAVETNDDTERRAALDSMVDLLNRRTYIRNLVRDVNEALET